MYFTRVWQIQFIKYADTVSDLKTGNTFFFRVRKFLKRKASSVSTILEETQHFRPRSFLAQCVISSSARMQMSTVRKEHGKHIFPASSCFCLFFSWGSYDFCILLFDICLAALLWTFSSSTTSCFCDEGEPPRPFITDHWWTRKWESSLCFLPSRLHWNCHSLSLTVKNISSAHCI